MLLRRTTGQAVLHYDSPAFTVVEPGDHVVCAVTGERIPLDRLTYWSVEHQEPYRGAVESVRAVQAGGAGRIASAT
jgi:hypothetical protein